MKKSGFSFVFLAAAFGLGCGADPPPAGERSPSEAERARAEAAADALGGELVERLFAALEASGPVGAIEVCSQVAQDIARDHSRDGLHIRRVSRKVRNPADRPDRWEADRLLEWEQDMGAGRPPAAVAMVTEGPTGHELRYLRPIFVAPPCLACHGDRQAMDADLVARLADLYPGDEAVGYEAGDLRGAVSVRLALDDRPPTAPGDGA